MRIIGYAFDAYMHCGECTEKRFPNVESDDGYRDSEGNEIHPVFDFDENSNCEYCGDCSENLMESAGFELDTYGCEEL